MRVCLIHYMALSPILYFPRTNKLMASRRQRLEGLSLRKKVRRDSLQFLQLLCRVKWTDGGTGRNQQCEEVKLRLKSSVSQGHGRRVQHVHSCEKVTGIICELVPVALWLDTSPNQTQPTFCIPYPYTEDFDHIRCFNGVDEKRPSRMFCVEDPDEKCSLESGNLKGSAVVTGGAVWSSRAEMYGRHRRRCMVVTGGAVWSSQAEMYGRHRRRCMVVTGWIVRSSQAEMYGRHRRSSMVVTGWIVRSSQAEMYGRHRRRCMVVTGGAVWSSQAEMYGRHRRRCMVVTGGDVWSSQAEQYGRHRRRCMVVTGGDVWSLQAEQYGRHRLDSTVVTGGDVWSSQVG
ncbi:hypothetical protein RRG08_045093 [Elysia crispata]|uniref:Uncharacterized protein n=1 Tax=Elysia crispata TaxID=231223 RepID=A0AAE0YSU8_9GAST|nr:hypothetical protein RRG08_045093 [Elysia crispata]